MASDNLQEVLQREDELYTEEKYDEIIELLRSFPDHQHYDIKWRLARALYLTSRNADPKTKKEQLNEGYVLIQEALALKDDDFSGHKWMAILLDAKSELDGLKERAGQLYNVKMHMEKAVELNPQDPTSWYILGEFALGIAELPWYQKKILGTIFANPPTGTYEEALEHFQKAESASPNFYSMNYLMMGKCYLALSNKEKAKEWLTKGSEVVEKNDDDKTCKAESLKLLKKL